MEGRALLLQTSRVLKDGLHLFLIVSYALPGKKGGTNSERTALGVLLVVRIRNSGGFHRIFIFVIRNTKA